MSNFENLSLENLMHEDRKIFPSHESTKRAHVKTLGEYESIYQRSIDEKDSFWIEQANERLSWVVPPTIACRYEWDAKNRNIHHTWFEDGSLNVTYNCLDRNIEKGLGNKTAIIWQGDNDIDQKLITYKELHLAVSKCANALKAQNIGKGDRVCIYLPMIPELAIAMLACARIGAIHSIVFAGFSSESLVHRINDSSCKLLICSTNAIRGGKIIPLKEIVDEALPHTPSIERVIVVKRSEESCEMMENRDIWYHDAILGLSSDCPPVTMNAEDPLFILYTSGSTGKPKGVVHTQAGYLLHVAMTHYYVFDLQEDDIYWCTADIGWITGHSYVIYGPLANGATSLMFEGTPTWPTPGRFWQIVEKYKVTKFYTAPTVIRTIISHGSQWPKEYDLGSLRILGSVGEPINPEVWVWYYETIGNDLCPVVDTWWQTETGGIMITPLPGSHPLKPGSASRPFFGVSPIILRSDGSQCDVNEGGSLCIRLPWPGIMRTTWGDHNIFIDTYFKTFNNVYSTGDGCRKDKDNDYWLLGRIDDVVNISGHRIGTAEVESAIVSHEWVAEAAVVPVPDDIKGQALVAFVILIKGIEINEDIQELLVKQVKHEIGSIAIPKKIYIVNALPKTRSGKIMRRILRKIAVKEVDCLGDISTLSDPSVVDDLVKLVEMD
ncbi:MAG: acetate--CoA ligase [Parachlamydiaceae bacterium]|nr:acetate--CoA ligase [Parachlamydiaceae bacterium]